MAVSIIQCFASGTFNCKLCRRENSCVSWCAKFVVFELADSLVTVHFMEVKLSFFVIWTIGSFETADTEDCGWDWFLGNDFLNFLSCLTLVSFLDPYLHDPLRCIVIIILYTK